MKFEQVFFVVIKHFQIAITHFFIVVSSVPVKFITLALFTTISIPPNFFTASPTALYTASSSWISTAHGRHFPPASSTEKKNVPNIYDPSALHYNTEIFFLWKDAFLNQSGVLINCKIMSESKAKTLFTKMRMEKIWLKKNKTS